ncbi:peptidase S8 and S53 subtilisin kexin sedolisin [Thermus scotoductus]|uniref:peptidase S8 and S53 subtilisin kexin sedolisin n=1 Tax=Thermus scotoductus TaxID=37636 RepID=UPI000F80E753|nr:peptidase S8 and S53 subtilisin kexin sedolisin [Thermus scotoductus]
MDSQSAGYAAAYQVGNGPWIAFTPSSAHTYTFTLGSNTKYGVAVRCNPAVPLTPPEVHVIQATSAELSNPKVTCSTPNPSPVTYTLNVDVSAVPGVASGDVVTVSGSGYSAGSSVANPANPIPVGLYQPPGSQDLLVTVWSGAQFRAAKVLRNVNVIASGSSGATLSAGDALPLATVNTALPAGFTPTFGAGRVEYFSQDNKGSGVVGNASGTSALSFTYRPVSGFASGDRYVAVGIAYDSSNVLERFRGFTTGNVSLALPSPWPTGSLTVTCVAHPTVTGLIYADPNVRAYEIVLEDATLVYRVTLGKGWLGSSSSYSVPDLSSQLGYSPFAPWTTVYVSISALLSPQPVLGLDKNDPASFTGATDISLVHASDQYVLSNTGNITLP